MNLDGIDAKPRRSLPSSRLQSRLLPLLDLHAVLRAAPAAPPRQPPAFSFFGGVDSASKNCASADLDAQHQVAWMLAACWRRPGRALFDLLIWCRIDLAGAVGDDLLVFLARANRCSARRSRSTRGDVFCVQDVERGTRPPGLPFYHHRRVGGQRHGAPAPSAPSGAARRPRRPPGQPRIDEGQACPRRSPSPAQDPRPRSRAHPPARMALNRDLKKPISLPFADRGSARIGGRRRQDSTVFPRRPARSPRGRTTYHAPAQGRARALFAPAERLVREPRDGLAMRLEVIPGPADLHCELAAQVLHLVDVRIAAERNRASHAAGLRLIDVLARVSISASSREPRRYLPRARRVRGRPSLAASRPGGPPCCRGWARTLGCARGRSANSSHGRCCDPSTCPADRRRAAPALPARARRRRLRSPRTTCSAGGPGNDPRGEISATATRCPAARRGQGWAGLRSPAPPCRGFAVKVMRAARLARRRR